MGTCSPRFDPTTRPSRLVLSIILGAGILLVYQNMPIVRIVSNWGFYVSWLASALMTLVLVATVRRVLARILEGSGEVPNALNRFVWVVVGGVVLPCLMALAMVYGLLEGLGVGFLQSGYMHREFPLVVLFVVILNLTYVTFHYYAESWRFYSLWMATKEQLDQTARQLADKTRELEEILPQYREQQQAHGNGATPPAAGLPSRMCGVATAGGQERLGFTLDAQTRQLKQTVVVVGAFGDEPVALARVACLKWLSRSVWVTLDDGREVKLRAASLRQALAPLPSYWFIRVAENTAIARKFLAPQPEVRQGRTSLVRLRVKRRKVLEVQVSRTYLPKFREWMAQVLMTPTANSELHHTMALPRERAC